METAISIEQIALDKYASRRGQEKLDGLAGVFGVIAGVFTIISGFFTAYSAPNSPDIFEIIALSVLSIFVGALQSFLGFLLFTWTFDRCFIGDKPRVKIISLLSEEDKKEIVAKYVEAIFA